MSVWIKHVGNSASIECDRCAARILISYPVRTDVLIKAATHFESDHKDCAGYAPPKATKEVG